MTNEWAIMDDAEAELPNWTCLDMTEDGLCGKPKITCEYRKEPEGESGGKEGEGR